MKLLINNNEVKLKLSEEDELKSYELLREYFNENINFDDELLIDDNEESSDIDELIEECMLCSNISFRVYNSGLVERGDDYVDMVLLR